MQKVIGVAEVNAASAGQITETSCVRPDVYPTLMIEENLKVEVLSLFRKVPLDLPLKPNEQLIQHNESQKMIRTKRFAICLVLCTDIKDSRTWFWCQGCFLLIACLEPQH